MKHKAAVLGVGLLLAAGIAAAWLGIRYAADARIGAELAHVAAKANLRLPRPYVDELVMERAHVDGKRLIVDIRIPDIHRKDLNPKKIPLIQRQEQIDLNTAACADPDFAALLQRKAEVARRFLDADRKLIFEIAATVPDCKLLR